MRSRIYLNFDLTGDAMEGEYRMYIEGNSAANNSRRHK